MSEVYDVLWVFLVSVVDVVLRELYRTDARVCVWFRPASGRVVNVCGGTSMHCGLGRARTCALTSAVMPHRIRCGMNVVLAYDMTNPPPYVSRLEKKF